MICNLFFNDAFITNMITILLITGFVLFFIGAGIEKMLVSGFGAGLFILGIAWACIRMAIIIIDGAISAWV